MSALSEIQTYWAGNSTLTAAVPAGKVYSVRQATGSTLPFVVLLEVSSVPTFLTGSAYWETTTIQFSVFASTLAAAESIADTIEAQFDYKAISAANISCERGNRSTIVEEKPDSERVYHVMLEYDWNRNRSLS